MPYYFDHWEQDGITIGTANPATVGPITADTTIVAVYAYSEAPPPPCFIATAAYGSSLAPQLHVLRKFRDRCLPNPVVYTYYKFSPPLADFIARHNNLRLTIRRFLKPIVELMKCLFKK